MLRRKKPNIKHNVFFGCQAEVFGEWKRYFGLNFIFAFLHPSVKMVPFSVSPSRKLKNDHQDCSGLRYGALGVIEM